MSEKKIGAWLIGALGSISTTVIIGAIAMRKGITPPTGMVTASEVFDHLGLAAVEDLVFGGTDVRRGALRSSAQHICGETGSIHPLMLDRVAEDLYNIDVNICMGTVRNCGEAIETLAASSWFTNTAITASLPTTATVPPAATTALPAATSKFSTSNAGAAAGSALGPGLSIRDEIETVSANLRDFRNRNKLDEIVVVNLASTEPPLGFHPSHLDLRAFEKSLDLNESSMVRASTIYAYAAMREGCPYINFTPSTAALVPALIQLAEEMGVPVMGNDGKTGETLVKSALAPMFSSRNLEVLSWEGFNILGNMDGRVLDHPDNRESKVKTKDGILPKILGYTPHSRVHIDYVPSLDDQKTAWDFIHFRGFLGVKMALQFIWQGYDSILAAPLVLDLIRLAELAKRRGERGLMPHLSSFFKAPLGVEEYRLYEQYQMLIDYARARCDDATKPMGSDEMAGRRR